MAWLLKFDIYIQSLIISSIILFTSLVLICVLLSIRKKPSPSTLKYFSAFTGVMLIIASIVGQLVTARSELIKYFESVNASYGKINISPTWMQNLFILFIFILGLILAFIIIWIINSIHKYIDKKYEHNHNRVIEKSLIMIILHRIPAGIVIGGLIYMSNRLLPNGVQISPLSMSVLLLFIIHIIPETIYTFYNHLSTSNSKLKTTIFMFIISIAFIPLTALGVLIFKLLPESFIHYRNILFIATGFIISWAVLEEILPNILSNKGKKEFKTTMMFFVVGFVFSLFIQVIHIH